MGRGGIRARLCGKRCLPARFRLMFCVSFRCRRYPHSIFLTFSPVNEVSSLDSSRVKITREGSELAQQQSISPTSRTAIPELRSQTPKLVSRLQARKIYTAPSSSLHAGADQTSKHLQLTHLQWLDMGFQRSLAGSRGF